MNTRDTMNGKPVFTVPAKTVINFDSGFHHKKLCDGPTFSTGSACAYSCSFCYVPDMMRKLRTIPQYAHVKGDHEDIVIRRQDPIETMRRQLTDHKGNPKYLDWTDTRVIYASPLVDVAANMELVQETIEACKTILTLTNWQIRLLSKSNLLPKVALGLEGFCASDMARKRIIYGVSTGTLDDGLAKAFEQGTTLVSKRLQSLHWLQDNGYRTYGMICPSLPQTDYLQFARDMAQAIRADRCETIWTEVLNARGESMTRTVAALNAGGFTTEATRFQSVSTDKDLWENYARSTFLAHAGIYKGQKSPDGSPKLKHLQYVSAASKSWWQSNIDNGAILL